MTTTLAVPDVEVENDGSVASRCHESMYRCIVETANEGIWQTDAEFRATFVNRQMTEMLGYAPTEMLGHPIRDFMMPEEISDHERRSREHRRGCRDRFERRLRHRNGRIVIALVSVTPLLDEDRVFRGTFAMLADITEHRQAEESLRESEERLRTLINAMPDIVCFKDGEGRWLEANDFDLKLFQLEGVEYRGKKDVELAAFSPFYRDALLVCEDSDERSWSLKQPSRGDEIVPKPDGSTRVFDVIKVPTFHADGRRKGLVVVGRDITECREAEERLRHLALHDALTDLPNRTLLQDRLQQAMSEAQREKTLLALLFLDLDRFKVVNDSLGHQLGDRLLHRIAERLGHHVRGYDTVGRLGGDEFVIILTAIHDASDAARTAAKLLHGLTKPLTVEGHTLNVTASIGISLYPADGHDPDTLLQHADTALHQAKTSGRNSYQFFATEMNVRARERLKLEHTLRQALEHDEFTLHYQPQVDCLTGRTLGIEALLRWRHPELGWVLPDRFISIAEESGLIGAIGEWVIWEACRASRTWQRAGLEHGSIAVNVSALQLQRPGFSKRLAEILWETGLRPSDLELEFTESLLIGEANAATLRQLEQMGVILSIDDFGTGYSSLSYLRRFAIDKVKIDRSFLHEVTENDDAAAIVTTIVTMAHSLRMAVVAEGVETGQQVGFLRARGCHLMQGYHFSRPLPAEDLATWLLQRAAGRSLEWFETKTEREF